MRDTQKIECLVQALHEAVNAYMAEKKARDAYDGYSWDYFGRSLISERERAAEEFGTRLEQYIDARVEAKLMAASSGSEVQK